MDYGHSVFVSAAGPGSISMLFLSFHAAYFLHFLLTMAMQTAGQNSIQLQRTPPSTKQPLALGQHFRFCEIQRPSCMTEHRRLLALWRGGSMELLTRQATWLTTESIMGLCRQIVEDLMMIEWMFWAIIFSRSLYHEDSSERGISVRQKKVEAGCALKHSVRLPAGF